jgi:hypothetical protein
MNALQKIPQVRQEFIPFQGGLDVETPPLWRLSGTCRESQNFDVDVNGGYGRIVGYERFDGRPSPSLGSYSIITATITGSPSVGQTLLGNTSGATGTIIALPGDSFVLSKVVGTFQSGEALRIGAPTVATATSAAIPNSASTALLAAQYINLAADSYRSDIGAVTGSGDIRGVCMLNDILYAFRDNAGGTACAMWKSSTSGWTAVSLGEEVSFTAGNSSVNDGDTLTQGGVTATILRVVAKSGTSPNIVGKVIITGRSGGNFAAGAATSTGGGALTLSGEFVVSNFSQVAGANRMYGVDGKSRGFEFFNDGVNDIFVPIDTGMGTDIPTHVEVFQGQLFYSFARSIQNSAINSPYVWSVISGTAEIAMDSDVTAFVLLAGNQSVGALAIFSKQRIDILYGSSVSDFKKITYRDSDGGGAGCFAYTAQRLNDTFFLDDQGICLLSTTADYGNFHDATISKQLQRGITQERTKASASCLSRNKSQYRLFFNDGYALFITIVNGKVSGLMPILFPNKVTCVWSGKKNDGSEAIYFGSSNGYVYQMDSGTSFDGADIESYLMLSFSNQKSPRVLKSYVGGSLEISGSSYCSFSIAGDFGYGSPDIVQQDNFSFTPNLSLSRWDSFVWDAFIWDGQTLVPSTFEMRGDGENVSVVIRCTSDYMARFVISGALVLYIPRRLLR